MVGSAEFNLRRGRGAVRERRFAARFVRIWQRDTLRPNFEGM